MDAGIDARTHGCMYRCTHVDARMHMHACVHASACRRYFSSACSVPCPPCTLYPIRPVPCTLYPVAYPVRRRRRICRRRRRLRLPHEEVFERLSHIVPLPLRRLAQPHLCASACMHVRMCMHACTCGCPCMYVSHLLRESPLRYCTCACTCMHVHIYIHRAPPPP